MRFIYALASKKHRTQNLLSSTCDKTPLENLRTRGATLGGLITAHTGAMMALENLSFSDSLWLTLTTATTVGYGDMSPETIAGRAATAILMYGGGITVLAQTASDYFDYRQDKRDRINNGKWRWDMEDHIVFLNSPKNEPEAYFTRLMTEFRKSALPEAEKPAVVVSSRLNAGLPDDLRKLHVTHVNESVSSAKAFDNSGLPNASIIAALSQDENDPLSDSITFDLVSKAREANPSALIIAEAVEDSNKERLTKVGADHVIRPIRSYPELLIRTMLAPGTEQVIEDLFDSDGEETVRYDLDIEGTWGQIAGQTIMSDIGTPLAYIATNGDVISNAHPGSYIEAKALIVLAREGNIKQANEVATLLESVNRHGQANDNILQA